MQGDERGLAGGNGIGVLCTRYYTVHGEIGMVLHTISADREL